MSKPLHGLVQMTNAEYHGGPGISKSHLDVAHKSLALYGHLYPAEGPRPERKPSDALTLGSAVHSAYLEPDLFTSEFVCAPEVDRRTKAGKAEYEAFLAETGGRTVLTPAQYDTALAIRDRLNAHPAVRQQRARMPAGRAEQSVFARCPNTGELTKCRFDFVDFTNARALDLKTTRDASKAGFARSVMSYRYAVQEAWYRRVTSIGLHLELTEWVFLAVETVPPYQVGLYRLPIDAIRYAHNEAMRDLESISIARQSHRFPDYAEQDGLCELVLPSHALTAPDADDAFAGMGDDE